MLHPVIKDFRRNAPLAAAEEEALRRTFSRTAALRHRETLVDEGEQPRTVAALLRGMALKTKTSRDGKRQITAIVLPGEICATSAIFLGRADFAVEARGECHVALAPAAAFRDLLTLYPAVAAALRRTASREQELLREWTLNLGKRNGHQRVAHFLCEMLARMTEHPGDGSCPPDAIDLPLTQEDIGDVTGLTVVYVNRVLQDLREAGLISLCRKRLVVHDWPRLSAAGDFQPQYLHLAHPPASREGACAVLEAQA